MSQQDNSSPGNAGAVEDKALDKESVIDLLGEEDDKVETLELDEPPKKGKEDESKKTPEGKEKEEEEELTLEDELEEDLKERGEEDLELVELPKRKEILAAYPDLFKKFPAIETAMYREQRYSELLPTIKDAEEAVEKAEILDRYDKEIMSGSTETLLAAVKDSDQEAFHRIVDNYIQVLYKVDQHAYYHTIGNVIKHTIVSMVQAGKEQNSEELSEAAAILNNFIFGTTKFTHPQNLAKEEVAEKDKAKDEEISQRERNLIEKEYNTAMDSLGDKVDNILKATVDKAIDPNESMSGYVKDIATGKVLEGLENLISRDVRFKNIYDRLWERAFQNDFDKESMDKIKAAYLSKARTLLPLLIKKERNVALKGSRRGSEDTDSRDKKGPLPVGRTRSSTTLASGKPNSDNGAKQIPKGMSTLDFLNSD
jgi:hypothetical protein